jgi:hypothetical protein
MTEDIAKKLKEEFPESPDAECFRFADAAHSALQFSRKRNKEHLMLGAATQQLEGYHDWRSCYGIDFDKPELHGDKEIWEWCVQKAMKAADAKEDAKRQLEEAHRAAQKAAEEEPTKVDYDSHIDEAMGEAEKENDGGDEISEANEEEPPPIDDEDEKSIPMLPQIIFQRKDPSTGNVICNTNGKKIFHVLAGRIDRFAASNETWALAISLYLDCHFDRDSKEKLCLLIDARAGKGWKNPKFVMVIPLTRTIINTVSAIHPGRWESLVIFPLPRALLGVWRTVKGYFHPETASVMHLISGPSNLGSPLPKNDLEAFVSSDTLDFLEKCREELCEE